MSVPGAGNCCCGRCCKLKKWRFNYPFYVQGQDNPWGPAGRPVDPAKVKLADWTVNSRFSVTTTFPDSACTCEQVLSNTCEPAKTAKGKTEFQVVSSGQRDFYLPEVTNISIRVLVRSNYNMASSIIIVRCPDGEFSSEPPYTFYSKEYESGPPPSASYDTRFCAPYSKTFDDSALMKAGKYRLTVNARHFSFYYGLRATNVTFMLRNLNAENDCP